MKGTLLSSIVICAVISKAAFGNDHQERHDQSHHRINHAANQRHDQPHHRINQAANHHQERTLDDQHHHQNRLQIGKPIQARQSLVETVFNGGNIPQNFTQFFNISGGPYVWNSTNPFAQFFNVSGGPFIRDSNNTFSQFTGWFGGGGAPNWSNPIQTSPGWPIEFPTSDGLTNPVQSPGPIEYTTPSTVPTTTDVSDSTNEERAKIRNHHGHFKESTTPSTVPTTTTEGSDSTNEDRAKIRSHHGHFKGLKKYRVHAKSQHHEKKHE